MQNIFDALFAIQMVYFIQKCAGVVAWTWCATLIPLWVMLALGLMVVFAAEGDK